MLRTRLCRPHCPTQAFRTKLSPAVAVWSSSRSRHENGAVVTVTTPRRNHHRCSSSCLSSPSFPTNALAHCHHHARSCSPYSSRQRQQQQQQQHHQRRHKSVFVSKHNESLHVTADIIIDSCLHSGAASSPSDLRKTSSHVVLKECPLCSKPTHGRADNQYKLYIDNTTGAYFCHRCGAGGSWFDWRLQLGHHGRLGATVDPSSSSSSSDHPSTATTTTTTASGRRRGQNTETGRPVGRTGRPTAPLPMPHPRLQQLYTSNLLDGCGDDPIGSGEDATTTSMTNTTTTTTNTNTTTTTTNTLLGRLQEERGLTRATLRKYGVGRADYKFCNSHGKWVTADCVTFPWIMTVEQAEYQEELRGGRLEWEGAKHLEEEAQKEKTKAKEAKKERMKLMAAQRTGRNTKTDTKIAAAAVANTANTVNEHDTSSHETSSDTTTPLTMTEIKQNTFLTRRLKVRAMKEKGWQRMDPAGGGWGLFGLHTVPTDAKEIVLTEGEYDAMAVWQATGRPAVSLPNGCRSLPVEVLPLLEDFDRIYLWMDNDSAGMEGAKQFSKKLGLSRCYLVKPTWQNCEVGAQDTDDLPKDANEALLCGLDLNMILNDATLPKHEHITTFSDLREDVFDEIVNPNTYVGHPITSLPAFNNLIKGFRRGEMTVITGPTGSGKTTFLGQLSLDLAEQDVNCMWGSFEIKNTRLVHKLLQQFARKPLPKGDVSMMDDLNLVMDNFQKLPLSFMTFHGGSDVDLVLDAMDYAVYVNDVEHIILDNMQFMVSLKSLSKNSNFHKFDAQDLAVEKFRKFATERNVHVTLVVHPRKEQENQDLSLSSIYGSAKATQEADTVLILQNDGHKKYMEVKKNRFDGSLGRTDLYFDRATNRYAETPNLESGNAQRRVKAAAGDSGGSQATAPVVNPFNEYFNR